uniref:Uncharacterized protein n=1 Tax=Heterorhabditis bacteriophora TaxID=37862 RepID=A0A1I7WGA3_HETBA
MNWLKFNYFIFFFVQSSFLKSILFKSSYLFKNYFII